MIPLLFAASAFWVSGFAVDALYRSRLRAWSLRLPALAGFVLAAGGLLGVSQAPDARTAVFFFTITMFGADLTITPSWQYCVDVGGRISGAVSGCMNMAGNVGSAVCPLIFSALLVEGAGAYDATRYFFAAAALNVMAVACWIGMKSRSAEAA
jgi:ACS family glucarate transporter-like MFS transporter